MAKHEVSIQDRPGRRAGIRRLLYSPTLQYSTVGSRRSEKKWSDNRDWSTIKDQLRLTVKRAPEVLIHVKGSRRTTDDDHSAIQGVLRYMMYVSRNGRLGVINERGEQLESREAIRDTHASWDLDMQRMCSNTGAALHPSFNMIFSMPANTDSEKIRDAVSAIANENFAGHQYLLALHTTETDPADNPPAHPHVHLILRAEDENGNRIHIRKSGLRTLREQFATALRARGIEANATSRAERGKSIKNMSSAEWHIQKRYDEYRSNEAAPLPSTAKTARFLEAAKELQEGRTHEKPWETAMAARRRDVMRDLLEKAGRLRNEGEIELADDVERFIREMPPLDSERRRMQRAMVKHARDRIYARQKEKDDNSIE